MCARVLHETLPVPDLKYSSETMIWKEEKRSRIRTVQMNKIRSLLGIGRMGIVPDAPIKKLYGMAKGVNERIEGDFLHCYSHAGRMENDRIVKRLYVGEFAGSNSAGHPRKEEVD